MCPSLECCREFWLSCFEKSVIKQCKVLAGAALIRDGKRLLEKKRLG